ncbi:transcription intermediary factor 1-beta-like isoform X2 [Pygocentrus nattereri]|uniref:transcription intermediary factor 1-beta-like isoform X2 n=1 Tax=Pygocentrus nattereri TaxID=42514 RepID=UPI00189142B1|nr:transcription intermediary factor 1-beta-like isoform X2 [Pygocentrus nattereri]
MERSSPPQMKPLWTEKSFGSCASCSLALCSASGPQLLPCLHALCKDCVSASSEVKECPTCKEKYELPEIVSNFLFDELSTNPKESIKCQGCEDASVTGWCADCQENLCAGCVAAHKRVKSARDHYVHMISPVSPRLVTCPIHEKELVNFYCLTCDQLICNLCRHFHLRHLPLIFRLQEAHEAVGRQRKQIQRMAQKVQQKKLTIQKNLSDLEQRLSDLEDLQARVRLEVKQTVVRLCNVIVKKAAKLNKETKGLCGKEKENLLERRSLLQRLEQKLDHVVAFTDKAVACQHHTVLLSCKRQVHNQLQELLGQVVSPTASVMELSFHTNEDKVKKVLKTFGSIVAREVPFSCGNTGNVPNPSPDHLTPNHSLRAPTVTFQKSSDPPTTVLPSLSLPQQNPQPSKKHSVSDGIHLKTTTIVPTPVSFSFSSSQNDKYYNFPNLKRAWSYHPYYPRDHAQLAQSSVKSVSPQNQMKQRVRSSRATPPQLSMPASSFLPASALVTSVSVKERSAPISPASSTKQTFCEQISGASVGGLQNNGFFNVDLLERPQLPPRQRSTNLSPSEKVTEIIPDVCLLPVAQAADASMAVAVPFSDGQKNTKEKEPTFTLPDTHPRGLLVSKGKDLSGSDQAEDRRTSFQTAKGSPFYHSDPPNGSGVALQKHGPVSATVAPFLVLSSCSVYSHAPTLPNEVLSGTVNPTVCSPALQVPRCASQLPLPSCKDSTAVISHKDTTTIQKREETLNSTVPETSQLSAIEDLRSVSGSNVSLAVESRASERSTRTHALQQDEENTDNDTMTIQAEINDLQLKTLQDFTQMRLTAEEKLEPIEENLAFAELNKSYSSPLKGEDKEGGETATKFRDGQGNLVVLESLGRDWLPDVSVRHLPIPDFPSSSAPAFHVTWSEESSSFQLSVIKEEDQCPAPDPISTPGYSNTSRPLLVSKLHCAACKIRGKFLQCNVCQRAFHRECHLPPVLATDGEQWQCMLCMDLSHSEDHELYPDSDGPPSQCLSQRDQKRCEYLLLSLSCNKQSSVLYRPVKLSSPTSRYIDMTLVRGRLLQKLTPPYRTPGEFVSDVWLLLHTLLNSSKEVQPVKRLQTFFSKELIKVFGQSLHPSLLKDPFTGNPEEGADSKTDA